MNASFTLEPPKPAAPGEALWLNVQVIYEDLGTGLRARRTWEEIAGRLNFAVRVDLSFWRCDLLPDPGFFARVNHAAQGADIVYLSGHGGRGFPPALRLWLPNWLAARTERPRALAVSLDPAARENRGTVEALDGLRSAAQSAGVEIFVQTCDAAPTRNGFVSQPAYPELDLPADRLEEPSQRLREQFHRHCGINE